MPSRGQGHPFAPAMDAALRNFFIQGNYKFSTNEPGRPSTFYFQDIFGNRGRLRRGHGHGAQVIFQGRCRRCFISPMLKNQISAMTTGGPFEDNLDRLTYSQFMNRLYDVLRVLETGDPQRTYQGRASLKQTPGWHVFDTNDDSGHCSSGTIMTVDTTVTSFFGGGGFNGYAGAWSVW